jgi:hypothetical protein
MTFPSPGILYRIRSTDFRACLELWDKQDNRVVLRNSTETNLQQVSIVSSNDRRPLTQFDNQVVICQGFWPGGKVQDYGDCDAIVTKSSLPKGFNRRL